MDVANPNKEKELFIIIAGLVSAMLVIIIIMILVSVGMRKRYYCSHL